jgi:Ca2+-binding EF-hand superfamily protein
VVFTAGLTAQRDIRFKEMDRNNDNVITLAEWRGSEQSFRVHDWNGDGVLSGEEVRPGASRSARDIEDSDFNPTTPDRFDFWSERTFSNLDHNRDGRLSSNEWHFDSETFRRVDANRDGFLSRAEFLGNAADDDRDDRFEALDVNSNGRIDRDEWHGNTDVWYRLDRNGDNVLTRAEVMGTPPDRFDRFASLDVDRDGVISPDEWHWSRRSFDRQDANGDGVLSRREFSSTEVGAVSTSGQVIEVDARERWTDTGIDVRSGDMLTFDVEGSVQLSDNSNDVARAGGARLDRRAPDAPLPQ